MKFASLQKMTQIPLIGLGTWRLHGQECESIVSLAWDLGYRLIDTATVYENHHAIGRAIRKYPREKLFLISKIADSDLEPRQVHLAVPRILRELQIEYLDLLLIHWPVPKWDMAKTLEAMLVFQKQGLLKAVGVSNFVRSHLKNFSSVPILINQIEMHPYLQRKILVDYCLAQGIQIMSFRPLAKGAFEQDSLLNEMGQKHGKTASQVALRWLVQQNIVAIPKASSIDHLTANLDVFDFQLSDAEMQRIQNLDVGKRYCTAHSLDD